MSKRNPAENINNNKNQINIVIKNELPKSKSVRKPKVEPKVALVEKEQETQLPSGRFINPSSRQIRYVDTNDRIRPMNLSTITGTAGSDSFNVQGENRQRDNVMTNPRVEATLPSVEAVEPQPRARVSRQPKQKIKRRKIKVSLPSLKKSIKLQAEQVKVQLEEMELEDLRNVYERRLKKNAGRKKKETLIKELVKQFIEEQKPSSVDENIDQDEENAQDENNAGGAKAEKNFDDCIKPKVSLLKRFSNGIL